MTAHAPSLTASRTTPGAPATPRAMVRRPAACLLALVVASLAAAASAQNPDVTFALQPGDSTVVEGHLIAFLVQDSMSTGGSTPPSYQWYRNDVAIPGATASYYRFSAQLGDHGARYHVVAQGEVKNVGPVGPTASATATLTVLPAGSTLPPQLTAPPGDRLYYTVGQDWRVFRAVGNDLNWAYRFDTEPADQWHVLSANTNGVQGVLIDLVDVEAVAGHSITVRVTDDAGVAATRTWLLLRFNNHIDINADGVVNALDLGLVLDFFGYSYTP